MTDVLIIGGGGMVGQKLAHQIARDGLPGLPMPKVALFDLGFPEGGAPAARRIQGNVSDAGPLRDLISHRPATIFYLVAIVSGESESNFDLGWNVNLRAFLQFLELVRAEHVASGGAYVPRVVFTSSIAVYGAPFPDKIGDEFFHAPLTSYGAQKASSELMLTDFSRKGFMDGISLRLPTICVRPGKANLAASSFFSGVCCVVLPVSLKA